MFFKRWRIKLRIEPVDLFLGQVLAARHAVDINFLDAAIAFASWLRLSDSISDNKPTRILSNIKILRVPSSDAILLLATPL